MNFEKLEMLIEAPARGQLIFTKEALSFWGGFDPLNGEVIDRRHPLSGIILTGKMVVLPGSRGSSSGSGVLLEALRNKTAPAALISPSRDHIFSLSALLALELYGRTMAVAACTVEFFNRIEKEMGKTFSLGENGDFIEEFSG